MSLTWQQIQTLTSRGYECGYCNNPLASEKGYIAVDPRGGNRAVGYIYVCHHCNRPTFFDVDGLKQTPGPKTGGNVNGIDDKAVEQLYDESRSCFAQNAFTAVVLSCRKLLMHIAVSKGAEPNQSFIQYVEFLSTNNYVPPDAKEWVDHIRDKGNEANHEIVIMSEEEAKDMLGFSEMLLKLVYEFPAKSKKYSPVKPLPE